MFSRSGKKVTMKINEKRAGEREKKKFFLSILSDKIEVIT